MCDTPQLVELIRQASLPLEVIWPGVEPKLKPLEGIRAVLWDIYGTLFISGSGEIGTGERTCQQRALADTLEQLGVELRVDVQVVLEHYEAEVRRLHQEGRAQGVEFPEVQVPQVWESVLCGLARQGHAQLPPTAQNHKFWCHLALSFEVQANPVWPMPGAKQVLQQLREAGIFLGLISNSQFYTPLLFPALMGESLESLGMHPQLLVFSYQLGHAKPGEAIYREAVGRLARLGIQPQQTLYVGNDMLNDILPARNQGLWTALFAGDRRSYRPRAEDPRCQGVEPDLRITRLEQIPWSVLGQARFELGS